VSRTTIAECELYYESPEAGRYRAPILLLPGLFQSFECWRPFTTRLAHRGWELYLLPRAGGSGDQKSAGATSLEGLVEQTARVAEQLARRASQGYAPADNEDAETNAGVIVFGADLGAHLAVELAANVQPMATVLFSAATPCQLGESWQRARGLLQRWGVGKARPGAAPPGVAGSARSDNWLSEEPDWLLPELLSAAVTPTDSAAPADTGDHAAGAVPTLLFSSPNDPLVEAGADWSRVSAQISDTLLPGHWWPALARQHLADEVHRFLVLTLGDRVVDFPDSIFD